MKTLEDRQNLLYERNALLLPAGRRAVNGQALGPLIQEYYRLVESFSDACDRQRDSYRTTLNMLEDEIELMRAALRVKAKEKENAE